MGEVSSGNSGANKLARVINDRIQRNMKAAGALVADFGTIQEDGSLLTNSYDCPIPKGDYTVLHETGEKLLSGDQVLVTWVESEAVVIDSVKEESSGGDVVTTEQIADGAVTECKIADAAVSPTKLNLPFHILL